jgi:predicted RND superfamily exporter protein
VKEDNPLYKFKNFLVFIQEKTFHHHLLSITFFSALLIILLIPFKPLPVYITVDKLINKSFETSQDYFRLKDEFKLGTNALVLFQKDSAPFNESDLCSIRKWAVTMPMQIPILQNSFSPLFLRKAEYTKGENGFDQLLFKNIASLNCDQSSPLIMPLTSISSTPWKNLLTKNDQKDFMHEFNLEDRGEADFEIKTVPEVTGKLMASAPAYKSFWLGDASYEYFMAKGLAINNALNGFIALIVLLSFRCFFGTWKSGIIFLGTLVYSSLILFALMSITNTPIDILNNCLVLLLTVSSLGDFAFLSHHQTYNTKPSEHWLGSFKKLITPSFFTSFTTFIGFVSLCTSDIDVIRRLGLWAGLSGAIEWITVMIVLPPFLKIILKNKTWVNKEKTINILPLHLLERIRPSKKWSLLFLSLIFLLPITFHRIWISDIPAELFKKDNPFRQGIDYLFHTRGFKGDVSLVFNEKENIAFNTNVISTLRAHNNVARIDSPYEIKNYLLKELTNDQKTLVEDGLKSTTQYQRFFSDRRARAIVYLRDIEMKDMNVMRHFIAKNLCPRNECELAGALVAYADFSQMVPNTLLDSFLLSLILVFICLLGLAYYTGNIRKFPALFATALWGVAVTLILMAGVQVRVNFVTCVVVSILVGMTGDNTIQYILGSMDNDIDNTENLESGIEERSGGSVITTFIMMTCSLIFLFYYFEPPRVFGGLLVFGFLASLAGDLWLLRGLIKKAP